MLICKGEISQSFDFLKQNYPEILEEKSMILALYAQQFLGLIRAGEITKAIELAQLYFPGNEEMLVEFIDDNGKTIEMKLEV